MDKIRGLKKSEKKTIVRTNMLCYILYVSKSDNRDLNFNSSYNNRTNRVKY